MSKYTILVFLIVTLFLNTSFNIKKGCGGTYYIVGTAYIKSKKPIMSYNINVYYGDKKTSFTTSKTGEFEVGVQWLNTCRSGSSYIEHQRRNNRVNPEKLFFVYKNDTLSISNEWKKFGKCGIKNKDEITNKKDLNFN